MIDAAKVLGEILGLLGGLGAFLGVFGVAMVILTLLILSFVNALSPASRQTNFFISVGIVTAMALVQSMKAGDLADDIFRILPYFIVMAAPYLVINFGLSLLRSTGRPAEYDRMHRIEQLTAELHREVEAMKKWD